MLNYEMPPLFIEVGMLKKKKSKKRMGENPKKKRVLDEFEVFSNSKTVFGRISELFS